MRASPGESRRRRIRRSRAGGRGQRQHRSASW
jgi:hypothetical protein